MTTPEGKIKADIKMYLDDIGAFWSMIKGGAHSKPGDPDMVVCFRGRYIGIEAKTPTGVQSELQKLREKQITAAGGIYILARSVDDVIDVMEALDDGRTTTERDETHGRNRSLQTD